MSENLIPFPDSEELKNEVEKLRSELSILFLERDELLCHECKDIEMSYMLAVGALEYKVYELTCKIRRQHRKAELIQAKKNQQKEVTIEQIEKTLDVEFAEYQTKLNEHLEKMNEAFERSHAMTLNSEDARELKKLYRAIVKALHPDLHPDLSDAQTQLFQNAIDAYEHGDLNGLRIISAMVADPTTIDDTTDRKTALTKEKERLLVLVQSINNRIKEIKAEFPYTMKEFVQSPERIQARKTELQEQINQLTEVLAAYKDRIAEMLR